MLHSIGICCLCQRQTLVSCRSAKKAATSLLVSNGGTPAIDGLTIDGLAATVNSGSSDDSDDSIVGEHSPFVKHAGRKRYVCRLILRS